MGRPLAASQAATDAAQQAAQDRGRRWLALRLSTWGMASDPPNPPEAYALLRRDLARALALPDGATQRAAVEAVGREHVGDRLVDQWLRPRATTTVSQGVEYP